jgi:hypothetical protein
MNAKDVVNATLNQMPDTATLSEIVEELQLQLSIDEGIRDIEAGRYYTHEEIVAHFLDGAPLPDISEGRPYPPAASSVISRSSEI